MSLILGFGKTEEDFEQQEIDFVEKFIKEKANSFSGRKIDFNFNDELVAELTSKLEEREEYYKKIDEEFDKAENPPERYSMFYFKILSDRFDLCIIFRFFHTHRKHSLSPDGWALLKTKRFYHAYSWDFILKEV
jgi:hypothetical protein